MNLFEILSLVGFAVVIALLVRIEQALKERLSREKIYRERLSLESTVRDFMPKIWCDPEFRENIVPWYALATGPEDKSRLKEWHWPSIANKLPKAHEGKPKEIERLSNLSSDFFREASQSQLLTEFEIRYLLFWVWSLSFPDQTAVISNDIHSFENLLSSTSERFLAQAKQTRTSAGHS